MATVPQILNASDQAEARKLYNAIHETHPGLERLALFRAVAECADKPTFIIGPSGTGKTMTQKWLRSNIKRQLIEWGAVGISTFKTYNERLQAEPTSILIEDLSVAKNLDIMIKTAFFLTHMTYEKRLVREVQPFPIAVHHFSGSCQIDFQPFILAAMTLETEWETDIKDKSLRWYHLRMPLEAHLQPPTNPPKHILTLRYLDSNKTTFSDGLKRLKDYHAMLHNFRHEFTEGRAEEHADDLLRALALVNGRKEVRKSDVALLEHLSRNFRVEMEIFEKRHLEGRRHLNPDILPILGMMATYRSYPVDKVMLHFQVKRTQIYNILNGVSDYVRTTGKTSSIIPTDYTKNLLRELGEW